MKHLTVVNHGYFLGSTSERLTVSEQNSVIAEYPLSRLKSVTIAKRGISLSADLIVKLAARGIKLFLLDYRGESAACLSGNNGHAVAAVRRNQFFFIESVQARPIARELIAGKVKNQRAVLKYFQKYLNKTRPEGAEILDAAAVALIDVIATIKTGNHFDGEDWRERLLGQEGLAAKIYWQALRDATLMPASFTSREKRGAADLPNKALNYGYAILSSYIWHCVLNAGLEPYAGFLHVERAGKPALVLDIMEEYRAWVVDRVVIKSRIQLETKQDLDSKTKKLLVDEIHTTFATSYPYHGRKLRLESILQRQIYRLGGCFSGEKHYRPYVFKW